MTTQLTNLETINLCWKKGMMKDWKLPHLKEASLHSNIDASLNDVPFIRGGKYRALEKKEINVCRDSFLY
jgi:hypothetical protein